MIAHFSANNNHVPPVSVNCRNQQGCQSWAQQIEEYMQRVLPAAEESFTSIVLHQRRQIICPREYEHVVDAVDQLGLTWREFAQAIWNGYIIQWYDMQTLPDLLHPRHKMPNRSGGLPSTYQITLRRGRQARSLRPKTVTDMVARSEYRGRPCRYQMTLRSEVSLSSQPIPLIVECQYDDQPQQNADWLLQITGAYDPRIEAEKWNADYTQRICMCVGAERTANNAGSTDSPMSSHYFA